MGVIGNDLHIPHRGKFSNHAALVRWTTWFRYYSVFRKCAQLSYIQAQRDFRRHFRIPPRATVLSREAISVWVHNLSSKGQTVSRRGGSARTVRTPENVEAVRQAIGRGPRISAKRHSIALGHCTRTLRRILHDYLHLHPYKMQIVQAFKPWWLSSPCCILWAHATAVWKWSVGLEMFCGQHDPQISALVITFYGDISSRMFTRLVQQQQMT